MNNRPELLYRGLDNVDRILGDSELSDITEYELTILEALLSHATRLTYYKRTELAKARNPVLSVLTAERP